MATNDNPGHEGPANPAPLPPRTDIIVVGGGPAGLAAAMAAGSANCHTLCAGQRFSADPARPDTRTTALLQASVRFLVNLGVWPHCERHAAALDRIRIIDDTGALITAPEIEFDSRELGDEPFGYNIANTDLVAALRRAAADVEQLHLVETAGATVESIDRDKLAVALSEGQSVETKLVAAADGRKSGCRAAAGITTRSWSYDQTALACNFEHSAVHDNCSNEFHRPAGPFTTVPLPGKASSLVWVERPGEVKRLMSLDDGEFAAEIEARLHGILGTVRSAGPRAAFPLSGLTPSCFARNRVMLIGEAAHVIPPIGAQGLNLGFRDAAALAQFSGAAMAEQGDPGTAHALRAYDRARRSDVLTRTAAVDLLNRSLLTTLLPVQALRGAGMHVLKAVAPVRRYLMRQGVAPDANLPDLMMKSPAARQPVADA